MKYNATPYTFARATPVAVRNGLVSTQHKITEEVNSLPALLDQQNYFRQLSGWATMESNRVAQLTEPETHGAGSHAG